MPLMIGKRVPSSSARRSPSSVSGLPVVGLTSGTGTRERIAERGCSSEQFSEAARDLSKPRMADFNLVHEMNDAAGWRKTLAGPLLIIRHLGPLEARAVGRRFSGVIVVH